MLFEFTCPYCNKNIKIDPCVPPQPKLESVKEQVGYNKRRVELQKRCKEGFVCPDCAGELVVFLGKVYKYNEISNDIYNKVFCSFCAKELDFSACSKEIKSPAIGYTFYCKDCVRKNTIRWLILIIIVFVISLFILLNF